MFRLWPCFQRYQGMMATVICATVIAAAFSSFAAAQTYTATDLGTLGGDSSEALAINNPGQVVGYATTVPGSDALEHPFVWSNGQMIDITGTFGRATGVNNSGTVTGFAFGLPQTSNTHAFSYVSGILKDLGTLPGGGTAPFSEANAINGSGVIVGTSKSQGMIYENGAMSGFSDQAALNAYAVNSNGDIVGILQNAHAFLFSGNNMKDLGTFDGSKGTSSAPNAINDAGQIVGSSFYSGNAVQHAFLYQNGSMSDLGTLYGGYSIANGINNAGDIVGESDGAGFLYHNGVMIDLNTVSSGSGLHILRARAINDLGQIVGLAGDHAVLLTPVKTN